MRLVGFGAILALVSLGTATSADAREVIEPRKITAASKLRPGEGALRLSARIQVQLTDTLFVYFVQVNEDGTDGDRVLQFERGAGVPIMGSNMIDPKPLVFRVPAGRYRPLAFTVACPGIPQEGTVCGQSMGGVSLGTTPTGYYRVSGPIVTVVPGQMTEAGDFIVEYDGVIGGADGDRAARKNPAGFTLRWRPLAAGSEPGFAALSRAPEVQADPAFRSRLRCAARPAGTLVYIPTEC